MAGTKIKTWLDAEMTQEGPTLLVQGSVVLGTGVTPGYTTTYTDNERGDEPVTLYASSRYQIFNLTVASASGQGCNLFSSDIAGFDWSNTTSNQSKTLYLGQYFTITMTLNTPNAAGTRNAGITLTYKNNTTTQTLQFNVGNYTGPSYSPSMIGDECCVVLWNVNIGGVQGFAITYGLSPSGTWYSEVQSQVGANSFSFSWFSDNLPDDVRPERPGGDDSTPKAGGFGTFTVSDWGRGDRDGVYVATLADSLDNNIRVLLGGLYKFMAPTAAQLGYVTSQLFTKTGDPSDPGFLDGWENYSLNPIQSIVSVHLMPLEFVATTGGSNICTAAGYTFKDGNGNALEIPQAKTVNAIHMGSIDLGHYFDAYQDFAPYTQIFLHLPFCGVIEIDPSQCMYGVIGVDYEVEIITGACSAWVWTQDKDGRTNYIGVYQGNCKVDIPLFADTRAAEQKRESAMASMSLAGNLLSGMTDLASGNALGSMNKIGGSAINYLGNSLAIKTKQRSIQQTGSFGGGNNITCDAICFLEIIRPTSVNPQYYEDQIGIPCEVGGTMSDLGCSGFTKLRSIDLSSVNATQAEKDEIVKMVTSGIYIQ